VAGKFFAGVGAVIMKLNFDPEQIQTPCYVIDESLLTDNLKILRDVAERADCKILLAQKAFSMFSLYPLIGKYLDGTAASGLYEARLGFEEMGGETHVFSTAYHAGEIDELFSFCDYIVFNSFSQWQKYREKAMNANKKRGDVLKFGIRINPELSTQPNPQYDPCAKGSRLGTTISNFRPDLLGGISGLHFHTLCEQNSDALSATLDVVEEKFGQYLYEMKWINMGGGHHITRKDYDIDTLIKCVKRFKQKYGLDVYLEPGEAIALNAGFLVTSVLDVAENAGTFIAVVDTSAACHISEVLEMRYRPNIIGAGEPGGKAHTYLLGGPTCFAIDVVGEYSFDKPLKVGDMLVITDMATYTMVKNNTFNGVKLPSIAIARENGDVEVVKEFGYNDFKSRLS
jgi:carboxynorspermidine decarboxylase